MCPTPVGENQDARIILTASVSNTSQASEPDAARAVLELAAGSIHENGCRDFLRAHTQPA
jgi:hypothetical protein